MEQAGFIYLFALAFKLFLFLVFFNQDFLGNETDGTLKKTHFLAPVFLGLFAEILFLREILKGVKWKS